MFAMDNSHDSSGEQDISEGVEADDDDKDSTDSDDVEPKLKYIRVANDLKDILENDAASCVAVNTKFLCVGTIWGSIYLLDLQGNSIYGRQNGNSNSSRDGIVGVKAVLCHSVAVNQISIDAKGDYIASCSDDGKIYIFGLYSDENHRDIDSGRLIRSIAIDPFYYRSASGRRFITGDERLVLHEKTFLSRLKSTVLSDASHEGGVKNIRWSPGGELVAWATLLGFRVYDTTVKTSLGLIKWNKNTKVDERCHLCWKDKSTLLVGWADTVRVCTMVARTPSQFTDGLDLSPYILQPVFTFETEFVVCGVGPLTGGQVVVLGRREDNGGTTETNERPHMHVIEPASHDYVDLHTDSLSLRGYQKYTPSNYSLECLVEESRYVIVSPKDIIIACPYDKDDHIDWLLDHGKYEEALSFVDELGGRMLTRHTFLSVGQAYIDYLLIQKQYSSAGKLCSRLLGTDRKLWEGVLPKFVKEQQLRAVIDFLPMEEDVKLSPHIYDLVLYEFLKFEPRGLLKLVREWDPKLYNVTVVGNAVVHALSGSTTTTLQPADKVDLIEALAILYSHDGKHELALTTYMKIKNKGIFELINKHKLFSSMMSILDDLISLDPVQTFSTLVQSNEIDSDLVVAKLNSKKHHLYQYLDALRSRDPKRCEKYEHLLLELYAEFCIKKLRPLLDTGSRYSIQRALEICQSRKLHSETALLLEKMGNTKEALQIFTHQLKDIEKAVDFCIKHDDIDLWLDVINYAKDKPDSIIYLLHRIGNYINPIILVKKINERTEIPDLKPALVKMMQDYNLQVSFMMGCKKILTSDYFSLQERLVSTRQKGTLISVDQQCGKCLQKLFNTPEQVNSDMSSRDLRTFHCSHVFHVDCLSSDMDTCLLCTSHKSDKRHQPF